MVDDVFIKSIRIENMSLLKDFLSKMGNSNVSFRYFESRSLDVISNHVLTILLMKNNSPIGYGHLDKDGDKIWLGISIIEGEKGKGYGKRIMTYLLKFAKESKIMEIFLTVDSSNIVAKCIYKKMNFNEIRDISKSTVLMKLNLDEI